MLWPVIALIAIIGGTAAATNPKVQAKVKAAVVGAWDWVWALPGRLWLTFKEFMTGKSGGTSKGASGGSPSGTSGGGKPATTGGTSGTPSGGSGGTSGKPSGGTSGSPQGSPPKSPGASPKPSPGASPKGPSPSPKSSPSASPKQPSGTHSTGKVGAPPPSPKPAPAASQKPAPTSTGGTPPAAPKTSPGTTPQAAPQQPPPPPPRAPVGGTVTHLPASPRPAPPGARGGTTVADIGGAGIGGASETIPAHIKKGEEIAKWLDSLSEQQFEQVCQAITQHAEGGIAQKYAAELKGKWSEVAGKIRAGRDAFKAAAEMARSAHAYEKQKLTPLTEHATSAPVTDTMTIREARAS